MSHQNFVFNWIGKNGLKWMTSKNGLGEQIQLDQPDRKKWIRWLDNWIRQLD